MKKMKCYDCEVQFEADTSKDMLNHMYGHYMKEHNEIITSADESEKKRWMEQFSKDWNSA